MFWGAGTSYRKVFINNFKWFLAGKEFLIIIISQDKISEWVCNLVSLRSVQVKPLKFALISIIFDFILKIQ